MISPARILQSLRFLFYLSLTAAGLATLGGIALFFVVLQDLPRIPDPLSRIIETPPTEIYAATGERLMVIGGRESVPLHRVSHHFIDAAIATEDHRFWEHHGIDKLRILKALWITLFEPGKIQGASTITQQLAKNLFFTFERSWMRKFQEMLVALQIESRYSKEDILEAYVNQIAFGVGAYGIEQAARTFFGVPASNLTLAEAALLAGLPKSPTRYNPFRHFDRAKQRQRIVLRRLVAVGSVSPETAERAGREPLTLQERPTTIRAGSYFLDMVIHGLEDRYGPQVVYHGGLKVLTTLDPRLQRWAGEAVAEGLSDLDRLLGIAAADEGPRPQGALAAVETQSGAVRAVIGGRDYLRTEYNRAVQNNRQPGSGFKPFLYLAAFENTDATPATVAIDRPVTIPIAGAPDWEPENFGRRYRGAVILKEAFTRSINAVAAQLVEAIGPETVVDAARKCGITSPLEPVYSLALGTSGVSPLEMAGAFATVANGGIRHRPYWIQRIEDPFGHILEEHIVSADRTLDPTVAYQVLDMMQGVVDEGTGRAVRRLGFKLPAAGKTGTTNGFKDAWFTGSTPVLSVSVWVGYDREQGMRDQNGRGVTGGRGAVPIWARFMRKATEGEPTRDFVVPTGIRFETVNPNTGMPIPTATPGAVRVALRQGQSVAPPTTEPMPPPERAVLPQPESPGTFRQGVPAESPTETNRATEPSGRPPLEMDRAVEPPEAPLTVETLDE